MTKPTKRKNIDYSAIKTFRDLEHTIHALDGEIEIQQALLHSTVEAIRYKYSFAHLTTVLISKAALIRKVAREVVNFFEKRKKTNSSESTINSSNTAQKEEMGK